MTFLPPHRGFVGALPTTEAIIGSALAPRVLPQNRLDLVRAMKDSIRPEARHPERFTSLIERRFGRLMVSLVHCASTEEEAQRLFELGCILEWADSMLMSNRSLAAVAFAESGKRGHAESIFRLVKLALWRPEVKVPDGHFWLRIAIRDCEITPNEPSSRPEVLMGCRLLLVYLPTPRKNPSPERKVPCSRGDPEDY